MFSFPPSFACHAKPGQVCGFMPSRISAAGKSRTYPCADLAQASCGLVGWQAVRDLQQGTAREALQTRKEWKAEARLATTIAQQRCGVGLGRLDAQGECESEGLNLVYLWECVFLTFFDLSFLKMYKGNQRHMRGYVHALQQCSVRSMTLSPISPYIDHCRHISYCISLRQLLSACFVFLLYPIVKLPHPLSSCYLVLQDANSLASFVVKCIRAVLHRGPPCWLVLENPSTSFLWSLPPLLQLLQLENTSKKLKNSLGRLWGLGATILGYLVLPRAKL